MALIILRIRFGGIDFDLQNVNECHQSQISCFWKLMQEAQMVFYMLDIFDVCWINPSAVLPPSLHVPPYLIQTPTANRFVPIQQKRLVQFDFSYPSSIDVFFVYRVAHDVWQTGPHSPVNAVWTPTNNKVVFPWFHSRCDVGYIHRNCICKENCYGFVPIGSFWSHHVFS